jgi:hypothetical protein
MFSTGGEIASALLSVLFTRLIPFYPPTQETTPPCRNTCLLMAFHRGTSACRHGLGHGGMRNCECQLCQTWIYYASADFAHRRMTHRSLGVGGYGFLGPRLRAEAHSGAQARACPWGSIIYLNPVLKLKHGRFRNRSS